MNITLPVEFPTLDLSTLLPLLALVVLAALIIAALIARTLIKSRAFTVALVAAVVILGSTTIVGGLQSLAVLLGVSGLAVIGIVIALHHSPDVTELLHVVVKRDSPPVILDQRRAELPAQPSLHLPVPSSRRLSVSPSRLHVIRLPKDSGF
jgi:hypothetical protein